MGSENKSLEGGCALLEATTAGNRQSLWTRCHSQFLYFPVGISARQEERGGGGGGGTAEKAVFASGVY